MYSNELTMPRFTETYNANDPVPIFMFIHNCRGLNDTVYSFNTIAAKPGKIEGWKSVIFPKGVDLGPSLEDEDQVWEAMNNIDYNNTDCMFLFGKGNPPTTPMEVNNILLYITGMLEYNDPKAAEAVDRMSIMGDACIIIREYEGRGMMAEAPVLL